MGRTRAWIALGRTAQILLGIAVAAFSFGVNNTVYYSSNAGILTAGAMGCCIAAFGFVGFWDLRRSRNVNKTDDTAFWIIFALDCLALPFGIAGATTVWLCAHWLWWVDKVTFVMPIVCGYLSAIVLLPFVIRSVRVWRRQPGSTRTMVNDYLAPPEKQLCARCHCDLYGVPEYYQAERTSTNNHLSNDKKTPTPRARSFDTDAGWSGTSESPTLAYPNIAAVTATPTRATSTKAPSYRTHA